MQAIQQECFKIGIPLRTRHREVAPNQYEFAPLYGSVTTQIDQNLMVMQIIDEVSASYGLVALMQEKPFQGVNGSGKHNNWSIATDDGTNLLNVKQLEQKSGMCIFVCGPYYPSCHNHSHLNIMLLSYCTHRHSRDLPRDHGCHHQGSQRQR